MPWKRFLGPLRLLVSGALLLYLIWRADPIKIWQSWQTIDLWMLGLALLIQLAGVGLSAAKWGVLLRARGQQQPYPWLLGAYLAGQFANNFLPTTVGGDALRITQLGRRIGSFSQSSASVFLERLTGFVALSLLANVALVLTYVDPRYAQLITTPELQLLTIAFSLAAIVAMVASLSAPQIQRMLGSHLPETIRRPMERVATALADYFPQGWSLALVLGMSLLFQSLWIAMHVACGMALGLQVPLVTYVLMASITDIVGLAPLFMNGLGARDLVFILYLSQLGISSATAIALAFMVFTVRLVVSILGGLVVLSGGADLRVESSTTT